MKNPLKSAIILLALSMSLMANESSTKQPLKTYKQEFCGYSISLPEEWKLIGDENEIYPIQKVAGMFRYTPGTQRDVATAQWAHVSDQLIELQICMLRRPAEMSISTCIRDLSYVIPDLIYIREKGTSSIQNQQVRWWIGEDVEHTHGYILAFGKADSIYVVCFSSKNASDDFKANCDELLKTFTFLEDS